MKLIYKEKDEDIESVNIECTFDEYLILDHAMKKYINNNEICYINRDVMRQMLEVKPVHQEVK